MQRKGEKLSPVQICTKSSFLHIHTTPKEKFSHYNFLLKIEMVEYSKRKLLLENNWHEYMHHQHVGDFKSPLMGCWAGLRHIQNRPNFRNASLHPAQARHESEVPGLPQTCQAELAHLVHWAMLDHEFYSITCLGKSDTKLQAILIRVGPGFGFSIT